MVLIVVAIAVVVYILTALFMKKEQVRRLWFIAFFLLIIATACSVIFMQFDKDSLLANAKEMSELYIVYFLITLLPALALINLWMFRSVFWKVLRGKEIVLEKETKK